MSTLKDEFIQANNLYAQQFANKGQLTMPPRKQAAILTCMDARLDPAKYAGFAEGDVHVIRNAGGRASDDAIRSLIISHKLLGTNHWFVIHHSDCGMETFNNEVMSSLLSGSLETAKIEGGRWKNNEENNGSPEGRFINWLTIDDQKKSVTEDVRRIRNHPLVDPRVSIAGFIYDVRSGKLVEIPEATEIGRSRK
jgi:carbonic anhydrase